MSSAAPSSAGLQVHSTSHLLSLPPLIAALKANINLTNLDASIGLSSEDIKDRQADGKNILGGSTSNQCFAVRNGSRQLIPEAEFVLGDMVILKPESADGSAANGSGICPAEVRILRVTDDFLVDEAIISGQSEPLKKTVESGEIASGDESAHVVYARSKIVSGEAIGVVYAIGKQTAAGKIAKFNADDGKADAPGGCCIIA